MSGWLLVMHTYFRYCHSAISERAKREHNNSKTCANIMHHVLHDAASASAAGDN